MNKNIQKLYAIASKQARHIIGLMSGTSLDGLDVALCSIEGSGLETKLNLLHFETVYYDDRFRKEVKTIFSKKNIELEKLILLHPWIGLQHAKMVTQCLQKWRIDKNDIDLIASHGQTIYHAPKRFHQYPDYENATLQIGDGDHLAVATGIITISDFRQKHIAAGGEGAPLAVYGDYILCSKKDQDRILINIGGITNFTYLPGSLKTEEIICTDTGPGNVIMDAYVQQHFPGKYFDEGGQMASKGEINFNLLKTLLQHDFFSQPFPKTTGPELFNLDYLNQAKILSNTLQLNVEDTLATLNKFTAETLLSAIQKCIENKKPEIYISGGGVHNSLLINQLKSGLANCKFYDIQDLGINPDAKEAVLFTVLANECLAGDGWLFENSTKSIPPISLGKISFPN